MLFKDIDLKNIAKEFKEIDKNTFIMDLQSICEIDCLKINKTNFLLSISCDGDSWELLQAKGSLYNLKARYIKVILQTPKKPKIEVLVRKYPGLFLMALGAGWGDRMIAFLNAMYLAKHTGFKFGFAWREINNSYAFSDSNKYQVIIIDEESKIFEKDFIDIYSYTHKPNIVYSCYEGLYALPRKDNIEDYKQKPFYHDFGYYIVHYNLGSHIKNIPADFRREYKNLWQEIGFTPLIKNLLHQADTIFEDNFKDKATIAIHIRLGDIIYGNSRSIFICGMYASKAMPVEIAYEIILKNMDKNILLFSDNSLILEKLSKHFLEFYRFKIYLAKDLLPQEITKSEIDLFEIQLMSHCKTIYSTSGFARLASLIGNAKEPEGWANLFSAEEIVNIFDKNKDKIDLDPLCRAYSLFCEFIFSKSLNKSPKELITILEEAHTLDPQNSLYIALLIECLLSHDIKEALIQLKQYSCDAFIDYLNHPYVKMCMPMPNTLLMADFIKQSTNATILENTNKTLKTQVQTLQFDLTYGSAHSRIKSHLSYKLGQALILNSKSLWGYIRMPYVLSYIKDKHKQEQKEYQEKIKKNPSLKLPTLESYRDYKDALKIKNTLSYQLGEAFIEAKKQNFFKFPIPYLKANNVNYSGGGAFYGFILLNLKE